MKTKIVYCLVSDSKDYYYEQLLISLCSLRKHNPLAYVEVVCDYLTYATLRDNRSTIYDYNVHVIPVESPKDWGKKERSRYLKTNLRNLTQGNYLYIDTDTVICSSLDFVDEYDFEIAAVEDGHVDRIIPKRVECRYPSEYWIWENAAKANINIAGLWQFNSGIMYVKDTDNTHLFYDKWFELYTSLLVYGVNIDQLSLMLANKELGDVIVHLAPIMNCQIITDEGIRLLQGACIVHWFSNKDAYLLNSPWIMDPIKCTGMISIPISYIIDDPYSFFQKKSKVVIGDSASLLDTPSLIVAYKYSHKAFLFFAAILDAYVRVKRNIHKIISFV